MKMRSETEPFGMKRNFAWNTSGSLFYFGCQWLLTVLVVVLSDGFSNAGSFSYAMAIGNIFAPIALFSVRVYQISDVANLYSASNYVAFRLCTMLLASVVTLAYLLFSTSSGGLLVASVLFLLFKADESFVDVLYAIEQKNQRMDYIGKSQIIRGFASLGSFSVMLWLFNNLSWAIIAMFVSCILVTLFYDLSRAKLFGELVPTINKGILWSLAKACLPIMISGFCLTATVALTRQYFGLAFGEEELGIYASIATPAVILQTAALYLYSPALVTMAEKHNSGNYQGFIKSFTNIILLLAGVVLAIGIATTVAGNWLLPIVFGPGVSPHLHILPFVMAGVGLAGMLGFVVAALIIMRQYKWMLIAGAVCFVCCLALTPVLISNYHMNGINLALISGNALGLIVGVFGLLKVSRVANRRFQLED